MFLNIEVWKNSSQRKQIFSRNLNLFFLLKQHKKINVFIYGVEVVVVIFQFFIIFKLISAKYTLFHIFRSRVKKIKKKISKELSNLFKNMNSSGELYSIYLPEKIVIKPKESIQTDTGITVTFPDDIHAVLFYRRYLLTWGTS